MGISAPLLKNLMRVTSFLATIEGKVAVSKKFYFILSVIHIISVRLLSFGTRVYYPSARADVTSV